MILADDMLEQREKPLNYGDISAQEVAERLLVCWNKHINESIEAIEEGSK